MLIFLNLKTRGFFYKNSWEGQIKEGNKFWFSFIFLIQLLGQEKSYEHYPNARRLLVFILGNICNSNVWNKEGFSLFYLSSL